MAKGSVTVDVVCAECSTAFNFTYTPVDGKPPPIPPEICGHPRCRAMRWTPEEWAGRARMAEARQAAGNPLDEIDRLALAKQEGR